MNRRNALTSLMLTAGASVMLPAWAQHWAPSLLKDSANAVTAGDRALIAAVVDALIPSNGTVGALSIGVDQFLIAYIADCLTVDEQVALQVGLYQLDRLANSQYGRFFTRCSQQQREAVLLLTKHSSDENQQMFFKFFHTRTVQGFTTSEAVMTNYYHYSMTHTFYNGDADVAA
jgi:hypothetical protein